MIDACEGNLERARSLGSESVTVLTTFGDRLWSTFALAALLFTELCAGNADAALGHVHEISRRFPERGPWWTYRQGDELEVLVLAGERDRALVWAARGEGLVRAAEGDLAAAAGALEEALDHHRRYALPFERARTPLAYGSVLTGAEGRVAELVVQGLSNKEVAARLFVTVGTVEATLTRVYAKLAVRSRSQLARTLERRADVSQRAKRRASPSTL
jgi:DNA-binding CsgD family transcriptional regulator